jgi:acyl dehydratase
MTATPSTTPIYLEDIAVGDRFHSDALTLDESEIKAFATRYDPQFFHLDHEAAKNTLFGGLAASGWHTAALTMRLNVTSGLPIANGLIGAGVELNWPRPVRPGDTLRVENEVLAIKPSQSRPDRGIVTLRSLTLNQQDEVVMDMTSKIVVFRRPPDA